MKKMLLVFVVVVCVATGAGAAAAAAAVDTAHLTSDGDSANDTDKDMYVVHAVVYEVGIVTNSSDDELPDRYNHTGSQESLTLYRGGGGGAGGGGLAAPLLTNVTSQSYVGVAPAPHTSGAPAPIALSGGWSERPVWEADVNRKPIARRQIDDEDEPPSEEDPPTSDDAYWWGLARSRRALAPTAGAAPAAPAATLALPPALLALDSSLADLPVPLPSTALVNYSRVNAVIVPSNATT